LAPRKRFLVLLTAVRWSAPQTNRSSVVVVNGNVAGMTTQANAETAFNCYRHGDRRAGVICQRCDRPICADCMHAASVGFHCPQCLATKSQRVVVGPLAFNPVLTSVLVGINVVVWLLLNLEGFNVFNNFALWGPLVALGEWYRLVTAGFLHDGVFHLAFNGFALWVMGRPLEQFLGRFNFAALYFVSILGGSFGALLLQPEAAVVGASGGIFGLFGAMVIAQRSVGISIWSNGLGPILVFNLVLTFAVGSISVGGHIGGLLAGLLVGYAYVQAKQAQRPPWIAVVQVISFGVCLFFLSVLVASKPVF